MGRRLTTTAAAVAWTKSNNRLRLPRVADPLTSDLPPEEEEVEAGEGTGEVDNGRDDDHILCCGPPKCAATLTANVVIDARTFNNSTLLCLDSRRRRRPWTALSSSQAATTAINASAYGRRHMRTCWLGLRWQSIQQWCGNGRYRVTSRERRDAAQGHERVTPGQGGIWGGPKAKVVQGGDKTDEEYRMG